MVRWYYTNRHLEDTMHRGQKIVHPYHGEGILLNASPCGEHLSVKFTGERQTYIRTVRASACEIKHEMRKHCFHCWNDADYVHPVTELEVCGDHAPENSPILLARYVEL